MIDRHDERVLLLLGLLSTQSQHGYQMNEFIEHNLGRVTLMKKATAYALLTRMEAAGLVGAEDAREGNRPTRRVYSITPEGTALMREMLVAVLQEPSQSLPPGDIAVMYIAALDTDAAIEALERRVAAMDEHVTELESTPLHPTVVGVDLAIERRLTLMRADLDWFRGVIDRLRGGEVVPRAVLAAAE